MKIAKCMSIVVAALLVVAFCGAATPKIDTGQSAVGAWFIYCNCPCAGTTVEACSAGPGDGVYCRGGNLVVCLILEENPDYCLGVTGASCWHETYEWPCNWMLNAVCG